MFAILGSIGVWLTLLAARPRGNGLSLALAACGVALALGCLLLESGERA
jgi:hypothetical protein